MKLFNTCLTSSLIIATLAITSCQKSAAVKEHKNSFQLESAGENTNLVSFTHKGLSDTDTRIFEFLSRKLGIAKSAIRKYQDSIFMVTGLDMTYSRSQVEFAMELERDDSDWNSEKLGQRMDMRYQNPDGIGPVNCTGFPKVPKPRVQISIYLNPNLPADWNTAMVQAIAQWNSINSRISFFVNQTLKPKNQGPYAWMDVAAYEDFNTSTVAYANLPAINGITPGQYVRINTAYNYLPADQKLFTCVHELGHTIGYRHTDQTNGQLITGTPVSDPASVMNAFVGPWTGFSGWDVFAHQKVYTYVTATGCTY